MLIFFGLVLFVLLVVVHEYGHLIAAKKGGVEVEEFGIGFPPRAKVLTKKNGTEYTLNWLPLGGFVKLKGEHDAATEKGSFGAASLPRKAWILAAGVLMNWVAAAVIFTIVALIGMPQLIDNQFKIASDARTMRQEVFAGYIEPNSPAEKNGIQQGDRILSLNNVDVKSGQQLRSITKAEAGKSIAVTFSHSGHTQTKQVTLRNDPEKGNFGVAPGEQTLIRSTWSAPIVGVGTTAQFTWATLEGLGGAVGNLFAGRASEAGQAVTGPVGIVVVLKDLAKHGLVFVLFLIGVISVSLAVMNVLPIPALDGGRLFVLALFRLLKKPLSKELEEKIHGTGMLVLLALAAVITVVDIKRFF
ncbi:MAG: site-2 protease family protein [Candidatus Saccharimonadales bacterium]